MIRRLLIVSLAVLLCTSAFGPAVVAGAGAGAATQTQDGSSTNTDSVRVTTGAQLSTIVTATSNEVRTEFENAAFEERLERNDSDDAARAAAIADRAAALENRSAALRAEYEEATAAYDAGDIDESTYAQRLASLNARAQGVVSSYDRLLERADDVSPDALDAANVSASELRDQRDEAARLTSTGTDALRQQFTGEASGEAEIEIETGGVSIEAETEDGERSREFERPRDGGGSLDVSRADAREAAIDALSAANGSWTLEEASSDADDGVYEFEFELTGAASGEAEVSVDGETGTVFALEEEIEAPDADDEGEGDDEAPDIDDKRDENDADEDENESERENDDERETERENEGDDDAALETDATVENGTVTVTVTHNGSAVSGATVVANDESVGTTGDDGTVSFAVPDGAAELEIDVTAGDREGELELDLEGGDRDAAEADEEQPDDDSDDEDDSDDDGDDAADDGDDQDDDEDDESTDRSAN